MMQSLRKEWLLLYADTQYFIHLDSDPVTIICNDKIIIDDILLYSNSVNTLIHFFLVLLKFLLSIVYLLSWKM